MFLLFLLAVSSVHWYFVHLVSCERVLLLEMEYTRHKRAVIFFFSQLRRYISSSQLIAYSMHFIYQLTCPWAYVSMPDITHTHHTTHIALGMVYAKLTEAHTWMRFAFGACSFGSENGLTMCAWESNTHMPRAIIAVRANTNIRNFSTILMCVWCRMVDSHWQLLSKCTQHTECISTDTILCSSSGNGDCIPLECLFIVVNNPQFMLFLMRRRKWRASDKFNAAMLSIVAQYLSSAVFKTYNIWKQQQLCRDFCD